MSDFPAYEDLPFVGDTQERCSWGVFGSDDELGTLNFVSSAAVVRALGLVRRGELVCLSLPLDVPRPDLSKTRQPYTYHVHKSRNGRGDYLDSFWLQCSTQWDGLQHIRFRQFGYYNGREEEDLDRGVLGIDRMAERGIISRAVLVDYARYRRDALGDEVRADERVPITVDDIERTLDWQHSPVEPGDILLFRTGWLNWYLGLEQSGRDKLAQTLHGDEGGLECPGLDPGVETAAWLWNQQVAAVAADNPALEVQKVRREDGFLHRRLIPLLGMPIGEFWDLERLSEVCLREKQYAVPLFSAPLRLPSGAGSPANAYAVF